MRNNLEKQTLIKKEDLNKTTYLQSLLQAAYHVHLLTDSELNRIQLQSIQLLARQTEVFTCGESSSVKIETAENILQSIFYSIGLYLKSLPEPDLAVKVLQETPISDLYKAGKKMVEIQFDKAKQLFSIIEDNCLVIDNEAYNVTIQKGIPLFFSTYDPEFAAHETPAAIDYPLSNDPMDLVGIEYIYGYLGKLYWENCFCQRFSAPDIRSLLRGYHEDYQDLLINIFELVLTNALGCALVNKQETHLNIDPTDRAYLQSKLSTLSPQQLMDVLAGATNRLCKDLNISEYFLQKYIAEFTLKLSSTLKRSLDVQQLHTVFLSFKETPTQPVLQFDDGKKLDDDFFRSIAQEIRACRYLSDKLALIQRNIHSITDLVDILEGSCVFGDEFYALFRTLGDMELALLLKRMPKHLIHPDLHLSQNEQEWRQKLTCFLEELDPGRRKTLQKLSAKISD